MDDQELITRNTVELLPEDEVRELASAPAGKRAYVGYEPSGVLHLGHMLTANKLIDLQDAGMDVVILLADVHAYLNGKGTVAEIQATAESMRDQFLAYGLAEDATEFVLGSEFQFNEDYLIDLYALGLETTLNRAQRAMAELQSNDTAKVTHVVYPLMQALDIEYLNVDLAVGGMDQRKVHALHREALPKIGYESRPALHTPIIADLSTGLGKMSASRNPVTGQDSLTLSFEDSTEQLHDKVEQIFFPPETEPAFDDYYDADDYEFNAGDIELHNPALQLFEHHIFPRFNEVVLSRPEKYGGDVTYQTYAELADAVESGDLHPADGKNALAAYLDDLIAAGREKLE